MANIDNTPPRIRLLVTLVVISVVTLVGLKFALDSYFIATTEQAVRDAQKPVNTEVLQQHEQEAKAFAGAKVPLDQAVAQIAKGDRAGVEPQPSDDTGSLSGWSKLPKPVPTELGSAKPAPDAGATATDGGAPTSDAPTHHGPAGVPHVAPAHP